MSRPPPDALLEILACPCDGHPLAFERDALRCPDGHEFACVDGIPILLDPEVTQTTRAAEASLRVRDERDGPVYVDTVALPEHLRQRIAENWRADAPVDEVPRALISATSGHLYAHLDRRATVLPIPSIPVPEGRGRRLLDIGCSWGRWSVSAARRGWKVVGLDPSLAAVAAARRCFGRESRDLHFVCGDARHLPFREEVFDLAFSYSVIQHFSKDDARETFGRIARVLAPDGVAKVQLAHTGGVRSTWHRLRGTLADHPFRVRQWTIPEMIGAMEERVGPASVAVEAFGGLGVLPEDRPYLTRSGRMVVDASRTLKRLAQRHPWLIRFADSVYVEARRRGTA